MYGVSKITSEQNILLTTFPGAQYSAQSLAEHLEVFARAGIVVDMICQSAPRGTAVDFSFTTSYDNFTRVMQALPAAAKAHPPLVSGGYSKINLFGEEMVTSCGVAARALSALAQAGIEIVLITTSDLDISLLIRQQDEDTALQALQAARGKTAGADVFQLCTLLSSLKMRDARNGRNRTPYRTAVMPISPQVYTWLLMSAVPDHTRIPLLLR